MILLLNDKQNASLVLHMSIMRKSYRNVVKKRHNDIRELLIKSYDYILTSCKNLLESDIKGKKIDLNITDVENLKEFLKSYLNRIKEQKIELQQVDKDMIDALAQVQKKCEELLQQ